MDAVAGNYNRGMIAIRSRAARSRRGQSYSMIRAIDRIVKWVMQDSRIEPQYDVVILVVEV